MVGEVGTPLQLKEEVVHKRCGQDGEERAKRHGHIHNTPWRWSTTLPAGSVCLGGCLVTLMEDWVSSQWVVGKENHRVWVIEPNSWDASCLLL